LSVWLQPFDLAHQRPIFPSLLKNVQVGQNRFPVTKDVKDAIFGRVTARFGRETLLGAVYYMKKNYGSAAKYFKKAVALEETNATYHVNLGAAWFSGKKMEQAVAEYARAMELDPDVFQHGTKVGVAAQIASPEERAQYSYLLAKIYAQKGDTERCLQCLRKAKEDGYHHMANVYKDEAFTKIRDNTQLHEIVPPPAPK